MNNAHLFTTPGSNHVNSYQTRLDDRSGRSVNYLVVEIQPAAVGGGGLDSAGRWPQVEGEITMEVEAMAPLSIWVRRMMALGPRTGMRAEERQVIDWWRR